MDLPLLAGGLGLYGFLLVTAYDGVCMMAVPHPSYYAGSFLGASLFFALGAVALRRALARPAKAPLWGLIAAESFGIAVFVASTISFSAMCAVWPAL